MPSSNTTPEQIVDKNGKSTTVHKGRATAVPAKNNSRIGAVTRPPLPGKTIPQPLERGSFFHAGYADGNVKYIITAVKGSTVETVSDDMDYGGMTRLFTKGQALEGLRYEAALKDITAKQNYFWESREDGEIVHYHNGFGQFVRGEIATDENGEKTMKPIALVGNWRELSGRRENGEVWYDSYAKRIIDGSFFKPNSSNMWENMSDEEKSSSKYDFIRDAGGDLESVEAKDISVPDITPEQEHEARIVKKSNELYQAAASSSTSVAERIANVRRIADELEALTK